MYFEPSTPLFSYLSINLKLNKEPIGSFAIFKFTLLSLVTTLFKGLSFPILADITVSSFIFTYTGIGSFCATYPDGAEFSTK